MFALIGKLVVGLLTLGVVALGINRIDYHRQVHRAEMHRLAHIEYVRLIADDGDVVLLVPETLMDKDGKLPNIIEFQGKTYERGWTNEGNTDRDERLWFEVKR